MIRPRSTAPEDPRRYGLGFWVHATRDVVLLEGYDAGVSFLSLHDPTVGLTATVVGTTAEAAWPLARLLQERLVD